MIALFRAMCPEEYQAMGTTLAWHSRFKWFSLDKDFITKRVKDGRFNNSKFKSDRYSELLEIEVADLNQFTRLNEQELMLDRRKANQVKILSVRRLSE